jgi:hypothetical protein
VKVEDEQSQQLVAEKRQARSLFKAFREVRTQVEQMIREELRFLRPLVSEKAFGRLRRSAGWNMIITARK